MNCAGELIYYLNWLEYPYSSPSVYCSVECNSWAEFPFLHLGHSIHCDDLFRFLILGNYHGCSFTYCYVRGNMKGQSPFHLWEMKLKLPFRDSSWNWADKTLDRLRAFSPLSISYRVPSDFYGGRGRIKKTEMWSNQTTIAAAIGENPNKSDTKTKKTKPKKNRISGRMNGTTIKRADFLRTIRNEIERVYLLWEFSRQLPDLLWLWLSLQL